MRTARLSDSTHQFHSTLAHDLRALRRIYDELAKHLVVCRPRGERGRGAATPGIPLNGQVVEVRSNILGILSSWASLVVDELGLAAPTRAVPVLTDFLARHSGWLAEHEAGPEAAEEVRGLVRDGSRLLRGETTKRMQVGSCPQAECVGMLVAKINSVESDRESVIVCTNDPRHSWSLEQWHSLAVAGTKQPRQSRADDLSITDIVAAWRVPSGTVYWLAKTHGWRRHRNGKQMRYNREDVMRTMTDRSARRPRAEMTP